jgi:hypothetical protein
MAKIFELWTEKDVSNIRYYDKQAQTPALIKAVIFTYVLRKSDFFDYISH